MGSGYKDFVPGDTLTATEVDGYLMRQSVMTFANTTARDTALSGVLDEGMVAYLEDAPNRLTYYTGSAWMILSSERVAFTPTWTNLTLGNGTQGWTYGYVAGAVQSVRVQGTIVFGSTTSVGGDISMTIPGSLAGATGLDSVGSLLMIDAGTTTRTGVSLVVGAGTSILLRSDAGNVNATVPFTWATGDSITFQIDIAI